MHFKFSASFLFLSLSMAALCACHRSPVVQAVYVDSLIRNNAPSNLSRSNDADLLFWKARIDPGHPGLINEMKYASALTVGFRQSGDIRQINMADSIYNSVERSFGNKLAAPFLALTSTALQRHRFSDADSFLNRARRLGVEAYVANLLSFDVNFELGLYAESATYLNAIKPYQDYNYYFRRSKLFHLQGETDSAIGAMEHAVALAGVSAYLLDLSLSNLGDLYLHKGDVSHAAALYRRSLEANSDDLHSLSALGWIVLEYDGQASLAEGIFLYMLKKNRLPDPLFRLYQLGQWCGDRGKEMHFAREFYNEATNPVYGRMYNKYLIEMLTSVLDNSAAAESIALDELNNRRTPQTYSWYAYALLKNGKRQAAYEVFRKYVSGRPLETQELFYMGVLLKESGMQYDAHSYFEAASKNHYELSPVFERDLKGFLKG